ncbi:MAG: diguanylate cyclase [Oleispira sp.]
MISQARQVLSIVIASVLAVPLLLIYLNAEMNDMLVSKEVDTLLLNIRQNNSELSEYVLRSRSQLDQNYDNLAHAQLRFTDTMNHFKASLLSSANEMNVHAEVVYSLYEVRMIQIEKFKSLNAQIKNSLRYLPKLEEQLRPLLANNSDLSRAIERIIINSLHIRLFNESQLKTDTQKSLSLLVQNKNNLALNDRPLLDAFIKHTRSFQNTSNQEQILINEILNNQLSIELELLERILTNQHHEEIIATNKIKHYLIIYAAFLLLLIVLFTLNRFHLINRALFLKTLSERDQLTNLNNRRSFIQHLKMSMQQANQNEQFGALIFIDLDGFKSINDELGHNAGDEVLKIIAQRLQKHANSIQTPESPICVARLGGDEFVVLFERLNREEVSSSTISCAEKIVIMCANKLPEPYSNFSLSASIGISLFPEHGNDIKTVLNCADKAMYYSKRQGKNRFTLYQPKMHNG